MQTRLFACGWPLGRCAIFVVLCALRTIYETAILFEAAFWKLDIVICGLILYESIRDECKVQVFYFSNACLLTSGTTNSNSNDVSTVPEVSQEKDG